MRMFYVILICKVIYFTWIIPNTKFIQISGHVCLYVQCVSVCVCVSIARFCVCVWVRVCGDECMESANYMVLVVWTLQF